MLAKVISVIWLNRLRFIPSGNELFNQLKGPGEYRLGRFLEFDYGQMATKLRPKYQGPLAPPVCGLNQLAVVINVDVDCAEAPLDAVGVFL